MTPQSTLSSIQPGVTRAAIVDMLATAMPGPDHPEILAANLCTPGFAVLVDRNGQITCLDYRQDPASVTA